MVANGWLYGWEMVRTGVPPWKQRAPKSGRGRPTADLSALVRSQVEATVRNRPASDEKAGRQ